MWNAKSIFPFVTQFTTDLSDEATGLPRKRHRRKLHLHFLCFEFCWQVIPDADRTANAAAGEKYMHFYATKKFPHRIRLSVPGSLSACTKHVKWGRFLVVEGILTSSKASLPLSSYFAFCWQVIPDADRTVAAAARVKYKHFYAMKQFPHRILFSVREALSAQAPSIDNGGGFWYWREFCLFHVYYIEERKYEIKSLVNQIVKITAPTPIVDAWHAHIFHVITERQRRGD